MISRGQAMATIEKRVTNKGTTYRVKIRLRGYPPESATFERKTDALEWSKRTEADMKSGRYFGGAKRHTFQNLADEYEKHASENLRSFAERKQHLRRWRDEFKDDLLSDITPQRIQKVREKLLKEPTRYTTREKGDGTQDSQREMGIRSGPTVNRYLATLSACLSYAIKCLGWLESNPCERVMRSKEKPGRVRFLSDEELACLLDACRPHADLYLAVILSLTTGARQSEIMTLRWSQIDVTRQTITLHQGETKNDQARALPLVGEALALLQKRAKVRSLTDNRVFPAVKERAERRSVREVWERALATAKIDNFRWHDLRHTAASYLVMNGVTLAEVAKILGHKTMAMVLRYAHLANGHIVGIGEGLARRLGLG